MLKSKTRPLIANATMVHTFSLAVHRSTRAYSVFLEDVPTMDMHEESTHLRFVYIRHLPGYFVQEPIMNEVCCIVNEDEAVKEYTSFCFRHLPGDQGLKAPAALPQTYSLWTKTTPQSPAVFVAASSIALS